MRILAALLLSGLTFSINQDATIPPDARATIEAANTGWIPALKKHDADAVAAAYAEDGVFVTATGDMVKGRGAIAQMMRDRFTQMGEVVSGSLIQDGLTRQGSFIYEWGHADLQLARQGAPTQRTSGRYLTVWKRGSGGQWQIVRNLSLPD